MGTISFLLPAFVAVLVGFGTAILAFVPFVANCAVMVFTILRHHGQAYMVSGSEIDGVRTRVAAVPVSLGD